MNIPYFISGDWPYFYQEQIQSLPWLPSVWRASWWFGENTTGKLWIEYPFRLFVKILAELGLSWQIIDKVLLVGIFGLAVFCSYMLVSRLLRGRIFRLTGVFIYCINTYFFLILGGGQLGVAAAYAFFPYALAQWMNLLEKPGGRRMIVSGVALGILMTLDLRFAYLFGLAFFLYLPFHVSQAGRSARVLVGAVAVALSLHLYWILVIVSGRGMSLPREFSGAASLSFFSFADMSHAISFLHPNWPENLFGRVHFLRPEFLLYPLVAFASLLFVRKRTLLYFPLLGVAGIFLAKGVNPPFGNLYEWFFSHIPGFLMFRDPTKFYVFIALSYAVGIPLALKGFTAFAAKKWLVSGQKLGILLSFLFLLVPFVVMGTAVYRGHTNSFRFSHLPGEYRVFKDMLRADTTFSRVLWLPAPSKFAYFDDTHAFVDGRTSLGVASPSGILTSFESGRAQEFMREQAVGYVVIPTDDDERIYLNDYVFDDSIRLNFVRQMDSLGLVRLPQFTRIAVYKVSAKGLMSDENGVDIPWRPAGTNTYVLDDIRSDNEIVMRFTFDPGWRLKTGDITLMPEKSEDGWTKFSIPLKSISKTSGIIHYPPDNIAKVGALISFVCFLCYVFILLKRKWHF